MEVRSWVRRASIASALPWIVVVSSGCRMRGDGQVSTIAKDRASMPPGRVIPPAGFGVDLVDSSAGRPRDDSVERASR